VRTIALVIALIIPLLALGDDPGMSPSIQEVKKQHEKQFLDMPGVVSVGIGLDVNGNQAIIVGLDAPNPEIEAKIPAKLEGFPVVVQTIGSLKAQ
jgi:ribosome biogenesis GTPase A